METPGIPSDASDYAFDAVVVGLGHAGIEAALALARLGQRTMALSITLDNVGYLACNPSIGGTAKGHLVREIDALGGEMGLAADACLTQLRMLNRSKGPAVHSLRAQVDKYKYHDYMKRVLENQPNLALRQGEVKALLFSEDGKRVTGVETVLGQRFFARAVVLACGVYLKSTIIVGDVVEPRGPVCFNRANYLSDSLTAAGIELRRFKTGTPARVKRDTVDLSALEKQAGEETPYTFSQLSKGVDGSRNVCYLGYTNERTHDVIKKNLHLSPKYSGLIHGTGARYCPSIEDKIVRFADKERHQFFLEPEGEGTQEMYVQGVSTSLPADVQLPVYRSMKGFERVQIMRDAYAIEYDCIDPTELYPTLGHKKYAGLYFAGQINGTSGYEEAGAQGIVAGMNAALYLKNRAPMILSRDSSYIGVLVDDLVTKGADEPYRMMTSRAEFRLILRQDNADRRLTPAGRAVGLVSDARWRRFTKKRRAYAEAEKKLDAFLPPSELKETFLAAGEPLPASGLSVRDAIRRGGVTRELFCAHCGVFGKTDATVLEELFTEVKYEGYIERGKRAAAEAARVERAALPKDYDYTALAGLRREAREKLNAVRPLTVGQAGRIPGVSPADVSILILNFCSRKKSAPPGKKS